MCVKCEVRKARRALGPTCEGCFNLVTAEGTIKEHGLENQRHKKWREQIEAYNALVKKGMRHTDIAILWGRNSQSLSSILSKRSKALKLKVLTSRKRIVPREPTNRVVMSGRPCNEHGGGKYGIRTCYCIKCVTVRNHSKMLANRAARARAKQRKELEQQQQMEQQQVDMPS